jgi:hypothetical protein
LAAPSSLSPTLFTPGELEQLLVLRARYQQGGDVFAASELAHLAFLRCLYQTGRLLP